MKFILRLWRAKMKMSQLLLKADVEPLIKEITELKILIENLYKQIEVLEANKQNKIV